MANTNYNNLTSGPIPELLLSLAIPSSIGLFFNTMYNVVDTFSFIAIYFHPQ